MWQKARQIIIVVAVATAYASANSTTTQPATQPVVQSASPKNGTVERSFQEQIHDIKVNKVYTADALGLIEREHDRHIGVLVNIMSKLHGDARKVAMNHVNFLEASAIIRRINDEARSK